MQCQRNIYPKNPVSTYSLTLSSALHYPCLSYDTQRGDPARCPAPAYKVRRTSDDSNVLPWNSFNVGCTAYAWGKHNTTRLTAHGSFCRDFAADWLHTHMSKPAQALAEENGFWDLYKKNHNRTFWMVW